MLLTKGLKQRKSLDCWEIFIPALQSPISATLCRCFPHWRHTLDALAYTTRCRAFGWPEASRVPMHFHVPSHWSPLMPEDKGLNPKEPGLVYLGYTRKCNSFHWPSLWFKIHPKVSVIHSRIKISTEKSLADFLLVLRTCIEMIAVTFCELVPVDCLTMSLVLTKL